jgi:hypothetical protein
MLRGRDATRAGARSLARGHRMPVS